jgi:acetyl esterase
VSAATRLVQAGLQRLRGTPDRLVRASFGDPPRSDRGIELDLPTHALLRLIALTGRGRIHDNEPAHARKLARRDGALLDLPPTSATEERELEVPGATGPLPARIYRARDSVGPRPIVIWLHGGGFVIGGLDSHRGMCSNLAARSQCVVLAVEYRKAPEHPFPAAVDDSLASFRWIRDHAEQLGGHPDHIAVGGDSAGANLSAVICQRLREAGEDQPALQVLIYPSTDSEHNSASHQHFAEGMLLTAEMLRWFSGHYLSDEADRHDPSVSPLAAERFDSLAPALIRTAGFDPLRDEGEAYADALRNAGVEVDLRCYERLIHNYIVMGRVSPANREAVEDLGDELRVFFELGGRFG